MSGADAAFVGRVNPRSDVGRLLPDGDRDTAGVAVETLGRGVVADLNDPASDQTRDLDVGIRGHLACHHHEAGRHQAFDGHPAMRVAGDQRVQNGVADLIRDLVRMPLGDRFRSEVSARHWSSSMPFPSSVRAELTGPSAGPAPHPKYDAPACPCYL